jgi:heme-degrading monooxygenase HmoA
MFAVIFIVQPKKDRVNDYLELAKYLKPKLEAIDGFIDNERFESKRAAGRILSLSTWRDEKSLVRWRTQGEHHRVQEKGRFEVFEDYRISIGEYTYDSDPPIRLEEQRFDETETGRAKVVTVTQLEPKDGRTLSDRPEALPAELGLDTASRGLVDLEVFESIYHPGNILVLGYWREAKSAEAWTPRQPDAAKAMRHRRARVIRDYGMFDRREAPQFYAEVRGTTEWNDPMSQPQDGVEK